jgi:hypothetical protein
MPTLTTVNVTPAITLVFGGKGSAASPVQVVNLDTENTVYLSYASNPNVGQAGVFPVMPLGSMAFDGTVSVWGVTPAGQTAEIGVVPGGSNYSPGSLAITGPVTATITGPVEVEGSISISGTPTVELASGTTVDVTGTADVNVQNATLDIIGQGGFVTPGQINSVFANSAPVTATAGSDGVLGTFNVSTYSSIIASLGPASNSSTAAGAAVCVQYDFTWFDINSVEVGNDTFSCVMGSSVVYEIPARGFLLQILMVNAGTNGTITANAMALVIDGSYRTINSERVVSVSVSAPPVITGATVEMQGKPVYGIASWVASIQFTWSGAVASVVFPLPQWVGQAQGFYQDITTALARNATIVDLSYAQQGNVISGSAYADGIILNIPGSIDANPVPFTVILPPTQCALILDTPATAGEFSMTLVGVGN